MFSSIQTFRINFSIAKTKLKHTFERINKRKIIQRFKFWVKLIEFKNKMDSDMKEQFHKNELQIQTKKAEDMQSILLINTQKMN